MTMAGRVEAHVILARDGQSWHIEPQQCPLADEHRRSAAGMIGELGPRCQYYNPLLGRRTCPYWVATTVHQNASNRVDGSILWEEAERDGKSQIRCGVLCLGARRNRPPGV